MDPRHKKSLLPRLIAVSFVSMAATQAAVNITTTFSSPEGYIAGEIDDDDNPGNQSDDWQRINSATATSFVVGPPGVTVNPFTTGTSAQASYQTAINFSEGPVTTFTDFTFSRSTTAAPGNQTIIGMAYLNNNISGNYGGFSALFGLTTTGYRIVWGNADTEITDGELGLNLAGSADLTSDSLRLSMTVTRLATAGEFLRELTLTNLATSTVIASVAASVATGETTVHADTNVYTSFHSAYNTTASITTGLNISQFGITQVPEPGTVALSLAGALLLVRRRR